MNEKIRLIRPDGRTHADTLITSTNSFQGYDGIEQPEKVIARVHLATRFREFPMITKQPICFDDLTLLEGKSADRFINVWTQLREAGIPVVPTVRKVSDTLVIMTDLTRYGAVIYGKHQARRPHLLPQDPTSKETHEAFLKIKFEDIREATRKILDQATEHNIALSSDGPLEMVVHPDGTWHLIALDIGNTDFNSRTSKHKNETNLNLFCLNIKYLKNYSPINTKYKHLK